MKPLSELNAEKIRAVFSDLDDTLTDHSQIRSETFAALSRLRAKGLRIVIVSGRPAGWADCLMRLWPVDAMVFENGAGVMTRAGDRVITTCLAVEMDRALQVKRLKQIFETAQGKIPKLKLATDQLYRLFDYAIDYAEEEPRLSEEELAHLLRLLGEFSDITYKVSSIHINYWCGTHTKVTACDHLLKQWGDVAQENVLYVGDSPNDEPLFHSFKCSVGVANVSRFLSQMKFHPAFITPSPGGRGFQEIVDKIAP